MKKIATLLSVILLYACGVKKENIAIVNKNKIKDIELKNNIKEDTLSYIQTKILDKKEYYIGKKFEVLLKDLDIPFKRFLYVPNANNIEKVNNTVFEIYSNIEKNNKLQKGEIPINIIVTWQTPLNVIDLYNLDNVNMNKRDEWTPEKEAYFKEQIVGDLSRTNYNLEKYKKK